MPRHRICMKCMDEIEARDHVMFHIQETYQSNNNNNKKSSRGESLAATAAAEDTRDYQMSILRQKIMSKHFRVAEYKRKKAAEEFNNINKKL